MIDAVLKSITRNAINDFDVSKSVYGKEFFKVMPKRDWYLIINIVLAISSKEVFD